MKNTAHHRNLPFPAKSVTVAVEEALEAYTAEEWLYNMQEGGLQYYPRYYGYGYILPDFLACWSRYWLDSVTSLVGGDLQWINVYSYPKSQYHRFLALQAAEAIDW